MNMWLLLPYTVLFGVSTFININLANDECTNTVMTCTRADHSHFTVQECIVISLFWPLVLIYLFIRYVPFNLYIGLRRLFRRAYSKYQDFNA